MRNISLAVLSIGASAISLCNLGGCAKAHAQAAPESAPSDLALTIYKEDFALVHDLRTVSLKQGASLLHLPGVSKQLDASSVMFDWPKGGGEVTGSVYNLGVASGQDMLKRLVGTDVEVQWRGTDGHIDDKTSGKLEIADNGTVVHTQEGYLVNPTGEIVVPSGQAMTTMPQLVANVQSSAAGDKPVGISYLTRGLSWSADYVAAITPDQKSMKLECWSTIVNHTGTDYPNARIRLVAGSPNRAVTNTPALEMQAGAAPSNGLANFGSVRTGRLQMNNSLVPTGNFYAYEIPARDDVVQEQMNRARILVSDSVPIHTTYALNLDSTQSEESRQNAQVSVSFTNDTKSGLGVPLPSGAVRAYDSESGSKAYVGASGIGDTPTRERVNLTLADAFDVYSKSKQLSARRVAKRVWESEYSTEVHNERSYPVEIHAVRNFDGSVKVISETVKSKHPSVGTLEWNTTVPSKGSFVLKYRVQIKR